MARGEEREGWQRKGQTAARGGGEEPRPGAGRRAHGSEVLRRGAEIEIVIVPGARALFARVRGWQLELSRLGGFALWGERQSEFRWCSIFVGRSENPPPLCPPLSRPLLLPLAPRQRERERRGT